MFQMQFNANGIRWIDQKRLCSDWCREVWQWVPSLSFKMKMKLWSQLLEHDIKWNLVLNWKRKKKDNYVLSIINRLFLALLLREIPLNCTEAKIQAEMNRISSLDVLRVHIAESGLYAYVQMRSADDAERIMLTLNKIPLLIDGCAGKFLFLHLMKSSGNIHNWYGCYML